MVGWLDDGWMVGWLDDGWLVGWMMDGWYEGKGCTFEYRYWINAEIWSLVQKLKEIINTFFTKIHNIKYHLLLMFSCVFKIIFYSTVALDGFILQTPKRQEISIYSVWANERLSSSALSQSASSLPGLYSVWN